MPDLAIVILTRNEEIHIARALRSVEAIAASIFVIDSGSTDRTVEIAQAHGATVLTHPFANYAAQFQWALDHAGVTERWIMRLDADEIIEPDLAAEIATRLDALPEHITGIILRRKHIFMGRWIRFGGRYPLELLRIFRRGHAHMEQRWMDEHIVLDDGEAATFSGGFRDENLNGLGWFIDKHNGYATREAVEQLAARYDLFATPTGTPASPQARRRRQIKTVFYNRLPFGPASFGYFLLRYILQLGFLDGRPGLIYHFLQGGWYRFLVGAKVVELEAAIADCPDRASRLARLRAITGLEL